jgi:serine/threonine protein kinase/tetratricopeptide (TPR) repeat protein
MPLEAGAKLGRYEIRSKIGEGGMGEVYLAIDTELDRTVAIKILPQDLASDEKHLQRFIQEAKAASALNHPNILTIYEIGVVDSSRFIAMEFIDGQTLRKTITSDATLSNILEIGIQIGTALAAAHDAGIVHRDIKPENVMIRRDGIVKVLDFGLAKLTAIDSESVDTQVVTRKLLRTDPGTVMGTALYMSPEQARGLRVDARTDVFSLGVVLYELIAGRLPFSGATRSEVLASIVSDKEPPPLARYSRETPAELERIVSKALSKKRDERYQSTKDLLIDLRNLKRKLEIDAAIDRTRSSAEPDVTQFEPTGAAASAGYVPGSQTAPPKDDSPRPTGTGPSTAEYIVTGIGRHKRIATGAFALVVLLAIGLGYWRYNHSGGATASSRGSIAVLPFQNATGDPNNEYLSDGLTESIINSLSQLPDLAVMSRSSVFRHKGRDADAQKVGQELQAAVVLTGRVKQSGDRWLVSAELIDVSNNHQIWGEQYNRQSADLLTIQQEIATEISRKLRNKLTNEDEKQLTRHSTENSEAYRLYLHGEFFRNKWTPEGTAKAIDFYNQAIAKDPAYALAYRALALTYSIRAVNGMAAPLDVVPQAKVAVTKALEIDETLAEAHHTRGQLALMFDRDWPTAGREFERAIELKPNGGSLYGLYACYLSLMGRHDEAIATAKRGVELDPLLPIAYWDLALVNYAARKYDEALDAARKAKEIDDSFPLAHLVSGMAYTQKGMYPEAVAEFRHPSIRERADAQSYLGNILARTGKQREAIAIAENLKERSKREFISPFALALLYTGMGDKDKAFAYLERSRAEHDGRMYQARFEPAFDSIRNDARFADLMRTLNLTP